TLWGGLAQLPGAFTSPRSLGGDAPRSMTLTVSGGAFRTTVLTPSTFSTLLSLEETASCASAGPERRTAAENIAVVEAGNRQARIAHHSTTSRLRERAAGGANSVRWRLARGCRG